MNLRRISTLFALLASSAAFATHPLPPVNLVQQTPGGVSVPAGGQLSGTSIQLTASSDGSTFGGSAGDYVLDIEVRPIGTTFSNVATQSIPLPTAKSSVTTQYPWITVNGLSGAYHWQARETVLGAPGTWVQFNSGLTAFTAAGASLSPTSLSFGTVKVNSTSAPQTITFTNGGSSTVTFNSATVTGPFAIASAPAAGATIAAGATATFGITATPTATGAATGTLTINTTSANSPHTASLSVTGGLPTISVNPTTVNFGDAGINAATPAQATITISNGGNATLTISGATATAPFGATGFAGQTIAAGSNKTFTVTFAPTTLGAQTGTLTITSDAATSPTTVNLSGNGVAPHVALSTTSVAFPDTLVGQTNASSSITATNTGTGNLHLGAPTVTGPFTTTLTTTTVAQGANTSFTISFAPTAPGPFTGSVAVNSDDANGSQTITLSGTARAPVLAVSPSSLPFGNVAIGASQTQTITLTNTGDANLTVSALGITGSSAADYALQGAPTLPVTVPANGGTQQLTVKFQPTGIGSRNASLAITSNTYPAGVVNVPLSGTGNGAVIALTPTTLNFSQVNIGASTTRTFNVTNSGNQPLIVSGITFATGAANDYSTTQATPFTVQPGGLQTVTLSFSPTQAGARNSVATIASNDGVNPGAQLTLNGEGIAPNISVTPLSINFGQVRVGQSGTQQVTISNTGTGPLTISSLMFTGNDAPRFTYQNVGLPFTIQPGASSATFDVVFTPSSVGSASAALVIASDDPDTKSLQVPLTAEGIAPGISVSTTSLSFGGQFINRTSAPRTFDISNTGSAPMQVFSLSITGAASSSYKVTQPATPFTVQPGGKQTVSVTLTAASAGEQSARLFIQNDAANGAMAHVDLVGLGISEAFTVTPLTVDFGTVKVGQSSDPATVTLTNQTGDVLPLGPATVAGANATEFKVTFDATSVKPGEAVSAQVIYSPSAAGAHVAELHLGSSEGQIPLAIVQLTGNSVSRILEASPSSFDFGQVPSGNTVRQLFQISNKTSKTVTIVGVTSTSPEFTVESSGLGPVEAGKSIQLPVNFTPSAEHLAIGSLGVNIDGAPQGQTELSIAVSGTGTKAEATKTGCGASMAGSATALWSLLALAGTAFRRRRTMKS